MPALVMIKLNKEGGEVFWGDSCNSFNGYSLLLVAMQAARLVCIIIN